MWRVTVYHEFMSRSIMSLTHCHLRAHHNLNEMDSDTLRILVTIPNDGGQFKFKLISSLIQDVQRQNEAFQAIDCQIASPAVDHIASGHYQRHHAAAESYRPSFSIIVEDGGRSVSCRDQTMYIPVEFAFSLSFGRSQLH